MAEHSKRDVVMDYFARKQGLPIDGKWEIKLEWSDDDNRLRERPRSLSQIDAMATNNKALVFF